MRGLFTLGVLLALCGPAAVHCLSLWLSPSPPPDPEPVISGEGPEYDLRREVARLRRASEEHKRWLDHSLSFTRGALSCVCVGAGCLLVFLSVKIAKLESRVEGLQTQVVARGGAEPTGTAHGQGPAVDTQ
jgi:hypothetical protein